MAVLCPAALMDEKRNTRIPSASSLMYSKLLDFMTGDVVSSCLKVGREISRGRLCTSKQRVRPNSSMPVRRLIGMGQVGVGTTVTWGATLLKAMGCFFT